jgi:tyrosine-protein phosphatase YwqE
MVGLPSGCGRIAPGVALNSRTRLFIHSERLHRVEEHYDLIKRLTFNSVLMQITAGSLLGFGRREQYRPERMLDDDLWHLAGTA